MNRPPSASDKKDTLSRLGLAIACLTAGMVTAQYALTLLFRLIDPGIATAWWANWVLTLLPLYGVGLPIFLLLLRDIPIAPPNMPLADGRHTPGKTRFTAGDAVALLVMGFGLVRIGHLAGSKLMSLLSEISGRVYPNSLDTIVSASPMWVTLIGTCVVAPIGEEFIFRKLFVDRARCAGDTTAILLSGLLFGLFHQNLFQFFYAFMLGILLAYVYTRTGRLWLCVGMHAAVNLMGSVVLPALSGLLPSDPEVPLTSTQELINLGVFLWVFGTMLAAVILLVLRFRRRVLSPDKSSHPAALPLREAILAPGMLLILAMLTLILLSNLILPLFA